jgi:hypothetical protein
MPTVTSRLPALIDYLVPLFTNAATIGGAGVTVYDGPAVSDLDPPLKLFVGLADPDSEGTLPAGTSQQAWGALGRLGRNETVTVQCCAEAWSGTNSMQTVRDAAYGIVAAVEGVMQADTTQFGGNALFPLPGSSNHQLSHETAGSGILVRVAFDLVFFCRIGGF